MFCEKRGAPVPSDPRMQIEASVLEFRRHVEAQLPKWLQVQSGKEFRQMEQELAALSRQVADGVTAAVLEARAADPTLQAEASIAARRGRGLRHGGVREVTVTLLGGTKAQVAVEYLKVNRRGARGRAGRGRGRAQRGQGVYPVLAALGVWFGVTPALAGEVCRQVADSDSVRAGRAALDRRGIDLGHKQTLRIVNKFSARAVEQRDDWLASARASGPASGVLTGKRVAIAVDGGRLRERCPARHGRRRKETGHRRYDAPWREPKLLTIYILDDQGRVDSTFRSVYDGTMGDCDAFFEMCISYLKALGAQEAKELICLGDGARWIWDRVDKLATEVGIAPERVRQVIDWCHAVAVLHEIADARVRWPKGERERWLRTAKRLLHRGDIDGLLAHVDSLAIGRRAKKVNEHRDYFDRNRYRMQYVAFEAAHIPTGSGAIESAIRRVINMRMKSNGMFWLEASASGMLLLRSYLKAGRLDDLVDWSIARAAPWWSSDIASPISQA